MSTLKTAGLLGVVLMHCGCLFMDSDLDVLVVGICTMQSTIGIIAWYNPLV